VNFNSQWAGTFVGISDGRFERVVERIQCKSHVTVMFVVFNGDRHEYTVSIPVIRPKYGTGNHGPFEHHPAPVVIAPGGFGVISARVKDGVSGLYKYTLRAERHGHNFELDPDIEIDPGQGMNSGPNN
jgi:hypothetical protein